MGRNTLYTKSLRDKICKSYASTTDSMAKIAKKNGITTETVYHWNRNDKKINPDDDSEQGFSYHYARAREDRTHFLAEEMMIIADHSSKKDSSVDVQRDRLRVDTRKFLVSRINAKDYGDKQQVAVADLRKDDDGESGADFWNNSICRKPDEEAEEGTEDEEG